MKRTMADHVEWLHDLSINLGFVADPDCEGNGRYRIYIPGRVGPDMEIVRINSKWERCFVKWNANFKGKKLSNLMKQCFAGSVTKMPDPHGSADDGRYFRREATIDQVESAMTELATELDLIR